VDFFLLLMITGAGDELQGIKKGVMELADAVVINKADSANRERAEAMRAEYARVVHHLSPATEGWTTPVRTCSALTGDGLADLWSTMRDFQETTGKSGVFAARRRTQLLEWMTGMMDEQLRHLFLHDARVKKHLPSLEKKVLEGSMTAVQAVHQLLDAYQRKSND
jgi:LAO/AO transport system kinase